MSIEPQLAVFVLAAMALCFMKSSQFYRSKYLQEKELHQTTTNYKRIAIEQLKRSEGNVLVLEYKLKQLTEKEGRAKHEH